MDSDTPYVWGAGGEQLSPGQLSARRRIAEAMMAQGMDTSPIRSPWQGLDRVAKAMIGAYDSQQADREEATARQQAIAQLTAALGGGQGAGAPVAAAGPAGGGSAPVGAVPATVAAAQPAVASPVKLASADPSAPLPAAARPEVQPTAKVWGDKEAEEAGLYDPPAGPAANPGGAVGAPVRIATAAPVAAAAPPSGPTTATRPGVAQIVSAMSNPFLPPGMAQLAAGYLKPREQHAQVTDASGNLFDVNLSTGQRSLLMKRDASYDAPSRDADGNLIQRDNSGKVTVLSAAEKAPTSVNEYEYYRKNFKPGDARQQPMDYETWATAKARAAATTVNLNNGGGSDKQIFDAFDERSKVARSTAAGLSAIQNARGALNGESGAITGSGADLRLTMQKVASQMGLADPGKVIDTETFRAAIAPQVAAVLKATVGTANISDSDRRFAEKAAGGSIELDKGSINRLLDIMERASTNHLKQYQDQLDAVYPDAVKHVKERALFGVPMPTLAPAAAPVVTAPPGGTTKTGVKWSVE